MVPTVMRFAGLRVAISPNDHRPPHVHVMGNGNEAVFEPNCPDGPVQLRENYGFARRDLDNITKQLLASIAQSCTAWEKIHGHAH